MTMGDRIKARRKMVHLTQDEFGELLGVQKSAVAKWENGRVENIKRSTIQRMAQILECSPSYLLGFDEDKPNTIQLTVIESTMLDSFRNLNQEGQERVIEYAKLLSKAGLYDAYITKDGENNV